jgi:hypothetical protein
LSASIRLDDFNAAPMQRFLVPQHIGGRPTPPDREDMRMLEQQECVGDLVSSPSLVQLGLERARFGVGDDPETTDVKIS